MFGFVANPCRRCAGPDYPAWRGAFCGLARSLARDYSAPARLLVNRDATFLALLGLSLDPAPPAWKSATCCNPLATPFPLDDAHPAIAHAAAVTVCGLATKLHDDASDEGPLRRLFSKTSAALLSPATDRAVAHLNSSAFPTAEVIHHLDSQSRREADNPLRADDATARAFGLITAHLSTLPGLGALRAELLALGTAHGRLVYWRDAFDDQRSDRKKGRFNPYFHADHDAIATRIKDAWDTFAAALRDLPFPRHAGLLGHLSATTAARHADFLGAADRTSQKKRKRKKDNSCCDSCDCCPSSSSKNCCDSCCDCGPGDSGCCDCCPCDGS